MDGWRDKKARSIFRRKSRHLLGAFACRYSNDNAERKNSDGCGGRREIETAGSVNGSPIRYCFPAAQNPKVDSHISPGIETQAEGWRFGPLVYPQFIDSSRTSRLGRCCWSSLL